MHNLTICPTTQKVQHSHAIPQSPALLHLLPPLLLNLQIIWGSGLITPLNGLTPARPPSGLKNLIPLRIHGFNDSYGHPVITTITAATTNRPEYGCGRKVCTGIARSTCRCVPDVVTIKGGREALLVPVIGSSTGADKGQVYKITFKGKSVGTALTCTGEVLICVAKVASGSAGKAPPECAPFESTDFLRDAMTCDVI